MITKVGPLFMVSTLLTLVSIQFHLLNSSDDTARKSDLIAPELTSFSFSGINIAEFKPAETPNLKKRS